jgi:hypothetical protein
MIEVMHEALFMTKSYFLEKDDSDISIIIEPIRYPKAKLTLTSISRLAVQYKMGILCLAFIFCCIRS